MLSDDEVRQLEFQQFEDCVYRECADIFPQILSELAHEKIYFLGLLYNGSQWSHVQVAVESVEGNFELVKDYKQEEFYAKYSDEELADELKWSPLESKRTFNYSSSMPKTVERLNASLRLRFSFSDEEFDSKSHDFDSRMIQACLNALTRIERVGVFSSLDRSTFVVNLVEIGQSIEERLALAKKLNPDSVYRWYESETRV